MKVLLVAGGTAGHVNPALAIASGLKKNIAEVDIHFAGRKMGMEYDLVTRHGYAFHPIELRGIQRSLRPKNFVRNAQAAWYLAKSGSACRRILRTVQPDLVLGTGGYVSGPLVREAARQGIFTALHEQNAYPGLANRLLAKEVQRIYAVSQGAVQRLGHPEKSLVTGNPVPAELFCQNREAERLRLGAGTRTVLLSFGGSLGAQRLNEVIAELAQWHVQHCDFLHIHATGGIEKDSFAALAKEKGLCEHEQFVVKEYIHNMPALLAAADLVICRAGALTLAEIAAVGRASVLIPSPNVAENHQYHNAVEFEKAHASRVVEEKDLSGAGLIETVKELTKDPLRLADMGHAAQSLARPNAQELIVQDLQTFCKPL